MRCHANARKDGQNFKLKTFIAGRNRLEDPGAFALAKAFQVLFIKLSLSVELFGLKYVS